MSSSLSAHLLLLAVTLVAVSIGALVGWRIWKCPEAGVRAPVRGYAAWCSLPAVWIVVFALLVIRARLALGEWPHPRVGNPMLAGYQPATFGGDARPIQGTCSCSYGRSP